MKRLLIYKDDLQRKGIDISKSEKVYSYTRFTINEDKYALIEVFLVASKGI